MTPLNKVTPRNNSSKTRLFSLSSNLPITSNVERHRRYNLARTLEKTLDRVNVLGNDENYGHNGQGYTSCVNALSWAKDGDILLSAGDDTTVRLWKMDSTDVGQEYPFHCVSVVNTGHLSNIFSAKMLPLSSRIATAARDMQIRIFDIPTAVSIGPGRGDIQTDYSAAQCCIRVIRCHHGAVKKIVTEESPDLFLSVSEDGSVRQHDLRTFHTCGTESCPAPLVEIGHETSALSLSALTPYQFITSGVRPYAYLFDRRHLRRTIEHDWGKVPRAGREATTCVRKFGRERETSNSQSGRRPHITGARMSNSNGHEVLLSYSGDGVYLFSTKDEPKVKDCLSSTSSSIIPPNVSFIIHHSPASRPSEARTGQRVLHDDANDVVNDGTREEQSQNLHGTAFNFFDDLMSTPTVSDYHPDVPAIMPRCRYTGTRNVMTVKDVNFLGPDDEWVASGSDDGNFFVWNKQSGGVQGIYEGDSSVVNVIEGHPHLPVVAISGIDTTVKLFAPTFSSSAFSRMDNAEQIIDTNGRLNSRRAMRLNIQASLISEARNVTGSAGVTIRAADCIGQ
ncbi:hypothetical protein GALMADRAFT_54302 [Galerina marginata CBS 339.88]|uniref:WD40 repeat-like protein n=1 Tax=Galerina marginata (strain CBS 339.88) TaxID=685588 RepID=A0A067TXE3_GALM3|nr:hypothetical protein GALMADRAFT_54302 [Galerina marginata CBS 339.88]